MIGQPERRFRHRLALTLGCTLRELDERLSSREIAEWMAYELLEPFGPPADALGHAIVASTLANINRGKDTEPWAPSAFMPQIRRPDEAGERRRGASAGLSAKIRRALGRKR